MLITAPSPLYFVSKQGLNTIQTYVFWNFHEHKRGNLTWEGQVRFMLPRSRPLTSADSVNFNVRV